MNDSTLPGYAEAQRRRPQGFGRWSRPGPFPRSRFGAFPRQEQIRDPLLKDLIGRQSDRILEAFGLQELVDLGVRKGGIGAEVAALELAPIAGHDRLQHPPASEVTLEPWNSSLRRRSKSSRGASDSDSPVGCAMIALDPMR